MTTHQVKPALLSIVLTLGFQAQLLANYALFNRHTDTIQVSGQTVLTETGTYEAVFLLPSDHLCGGNIFEEFVGGEEDKQLRVYPRRITGNSWDGASRQTWLYAAITVQPDVWHHVAMVTDASGDRLYLDGKLVASQPNHGRIMNHGSRLAHIGALYRETAFYGFIGILDSVRVSSVARYKGLNFSPPSGDMANEPGTVLLYNFKDVDGSGAIADESSLRRTGTPGTGFEGATKPKILNSLPELTGSQGQDLLIDPRATYFRVTEGDRAFDTVPISLESLGIAEGDTVFMQRIGGFNATGNYVEDADTPKYPLTAVFSATPELGPSSAERRVLGAIKAGIEYKNPLPGNAATDIPEDFEVTLPGVLIQVPPGAKYLFLAANDSRYDNNFELDPNFGCHISRFTLATRKEPNHMVVHWDTGVLQSKGGASEQWTDVPKANSPQRVPTTAPLQMFRLRQP